MQLDSLVIDPAEAEAKVAEYEAQVAEGRTVEDLAILQAYRAAKRGLPVISLPDVIAAGGHFPSGLPRLAVARADATESYCTVGRSDRGDEFRDVVYAENRNQAWRQSALVGSRTVRVTVPRPDGIPDWPRGGTTMVPLVPPNHRPKRPKLARLHVLWEVEAWEPVPPVDPALIRHLRGDLWTVLAVWDLTDLERAVLSQRIRA